MGRHPARHRGRRLFVLEVDESFVVHHCASARAIDPDDPRSGRPWALAAAAVLRSLPEPAEEAELPSAPRAAPWRAAQLALAEALLTGPAMRLRGISAERILEGLVSRHLSPLVPAPR